MPTQAEETNEKLPNKIVSLLSEEGQKAYFPKKGLMIQTEEAKHCVINATVGVAYNDDRQPLVLPAFFDLLQNLGHEAFLYSNSYGNGDLRIAWKEHILSMNSTLYADHITTPVVTGGITGALRVGCELFLQEDEHLLLPDLYWGNYKLIYKREQFKTYPLFDEGKLNIKGFLDELGKEDKIVTVIGFPNNPSGYMPTKEEVKQMLTGIEAQAEKGTQLIIFVDDAYVGLAYEHESEKESLFGKLAQLHENVLAIKIDGITKEYFAWGLRIGFITFGYKGMTQEAAQALEDKAAGLVRGACSNVSTPAQHAAVYVLANPDTEHQQKQAIALLRNRYYLAKKALQKEKYKKHFTPLPHNAGYFLCLQPLLCEAEDIRKRLLHEDYSLGVVSTQGLIRVAFSCVPTQDIEAVFEKIYAVCEELTKEADVCELPQEIMLQHNI